MTSGIEIHHYKSFRLDIFRWIGGWLSRVGVVVVVGIVSLAIGVIWDEGQASVASAHSTCSMTVAARGLLFICFDLMIRR